jgi:hypothetical protein
MSLFSTVLPVIVIPEEPASIFPEMLRKALDKQAHPVLR